RLEDRTLLCGGIQPAVPLVLNADHLAAASGSLPATDFYEVTLTEPGRLTTQVHVTGADTRLSLLGPDRQLLIQSDGQSAGNPDDLIPQHLLPGTYFLEVEGLGGRKGSYVLTSQFEAANPPNQPLLVDFLHDFPFALNPWFLATGDFNRDGILDIASPNAATNDVTVLLGLGDGTFHSAGNCAAGNAAVGRAPGAFAEHAFRALPAPNQKAPPGIPAGAGVTAYGYDVSILLGNGDGTFQPERRFSAGNRAWGIAAADLNG